MSRGLGRVVDHDERSRAFPARGAVAQRSVLWGHHAPVLDQGSLSSCTGNAAAQLINTDVFASCRPHGYLTEMDAVKLYSYATRMDGISNNTYPPIDQGSSGLGVAKAGVQLGYFRAYKHCFGFDQFASAVQLQPLIVGTNWYDGMTKPDKDGFGHPTGALAGGHEYLCLGISYETQTLTFLNSWGSGWGKSGRFFMHFEDFKGLLADRGDATAPVKL